MRTVFIAFWLLLPVAIAAEFSAGMGAYMAFLDQPPAPVYGASLRIPLPARFGVRPEFWTGTQGAWTHTVVGGSVTYDLSRRNRRVVPYIVGTVGAVFSTYDPIAYTSTARAALVGFGVRYSFADKWVIDGEFRAGQSAYPLTTFQIGYRWNKRK